VWHIQATLKTGPAYTICKIRKQNGGEVRIGDACGIERWFPHRPARPAAATPEISATSFLAEGRVA
jgi:hypothetical protein